MNIYSTNFTRNNPEIPTFHIKGGMERFSHTFCLPETALLKTGRPFFVPDFPGEMVMELQLVVRMGRLGKNISERFADRYCETCTIGLLFSASTCLQHQQQQGLPWFTAYGFDGSVSIGKWIPFTELEQQFPRSLALKVNGQAAAWTETLLLQPSLHAFIAALSKWNTIRQGDLICVGGLHPSLPVHPGLHVDGEVDGFPLMSFNVK